MFGFGLGSLVGSSAIILLGLDLCPQELLAGGFVLACGISVRRHNLLSVSIDFAAIEHPLLCSSADDSEAELGGKPI